MLSSNEPSKDVVIPDKLANILETHINYVLNNESINSGTKILYLEYAMSKPSVRFLEKLDLLYQSDEKGKSNLSLIQALKSINDICYKNPAQKKLEENIRNFITKENVERIKEQQNKRRKEEYDVNLVNDQWRFASNPSDSHESSYFVTAAHNAAIASLAEYKIDFPHLNQWQKNSKNLSFTPDHQEALLFLLKEQKMTPDAAIKEISGLSSDQAKSLTELFSLGLRGEHLRDWNLNSNIVFTADHQALLKWLMEKKLSPKDTVEEIKGITYHQANTLQALYNSGLRGQHLRLWRELSPDTFFSLEHQKTLTELMKNEKPDDAIQSLIKMTTSQKEILLQQSVTAQAPKEKKEKETKRYEAPSQLGKLAHNNQPPSKIMGVTLDKFHLFAPRESHSNISISVLDWDDTPLPSTYSQRQRSAMSLIFPSGDQPTYYERLLNLYRRSTPLVTGTLGARSDRSELQALGRTTRTYRVGGAVREPNVGNSGLQQPSFDSPPTFFQPDEKTQLINEFKNQDESKQITSQHLEDWQRASPNIDFTVFHRSAVKYLLTEQKLTPAVAIEEIKGLGLMQISTLEELYANGLRGHHLRTWSQNSGTIVFQSEHRMALARLIRDNGVSVENAITAISGLDDTAVREIGRTSGRRWIDDVD